MSSMPGAAGFTTQQGHVTPTQRIAPTAASEGVTAKPLDASRTMAEKARSIAERAREDATTVSVDQRMRVEVEWHAASLSYVHRILSPRTGEQLAQLPAAQVLDLVDDLMKQIEKG